MSPLAERMVRDQWEQLGRPPVSVVAEAALSQLESTWCLVGLALVEGCCWVLLGDHLQP